MPKNEKSKIWRLSERANEVVSKIITPKRVEIILLFLVPIKIDSRPRNHQMISSMARVNILIMQAPSRSPNAKSGILTKAAAETPFASSGKEVIIARRTTPIQAWDNPVFSAMTSPYLVSFDPAMKMIAAQMINFSQTISPYSITRLLVLL